MSVRSPSVPVDADPSRRCGLTTIVAYLAVDRTAYADLCRDAGVAPLSLDSVQLLIAPITHG